MFVFGNIGGGIERKPGNLRIALAIFAVGQLAVPQMSHAAGYTAPSSLDASMKALGPTSEVFAHFRSKSHREQSLEFTNVDSGRQSRPHRIRLSVFAGCGRSVLLPGGKVLFE
jgi:hypothetical protein